MKKLYLTTALFYVQLFFAQVGINTTAPNAQLDIRSSNQAAPASTDGMLVPKIDAFPASNPTAAQQGMMVYLTTAAGSNQPGFYYWDNATASWLSFGNNSNSWRTGGNTGTSAATHFLGTTDNADLIFKRFNTAAGRIGAANTFFGVSSGSVSAGTNNTYLGAVAGQSNTSGSQNVMVGRAAGGLGVSGSDNVFVGNGAGIFNSANQNTFIGSFAGNGNGIGVNNTSVGYFSGANTSTGGNNIFVGAFAGNANTTGAKNSFLGSGANAAANNLANATAVGAEAFVGASNSLVLGSINGVNSATASTNVGIGTATPAERLHVVGNIRMVDGNQGAGKVLTSDANGTASWGNASANAWGLSGNSATSAATHFIGTTDNVDLVLKTNNQDNFRIKNDGRIEIGNLGTNPTYINSTSSSKRLFMASDGINNNVFFQNSNSSGDPISMFFGVSSGTTLAPTALTSSQNIGNFYFTGYDGAKFAAAANINCAIDGTPALNSMPGSLSFSTTAVGSVSPSTRMTIKNNGNIGMGTNTPLDKLHVVGNIRMVDGNQATGKVLTSDANGTANWQSIPVSGWGLTGNSGTSASTNFVGTTDDADLVFKRFGTRAGFIGTTNTSLGLAALNPASTGVDNTAIGSGSLDVNTTGFDNVGVGYNTLTSNTGGDHNTAVGVAALVSNANGDYNTAIGRSALFDNTASNNTAIGYNALNNVSTGTNNTAVGANAFTGFNSGSNNTSIGAETSSLSTLYENATAIGYKATVGNSNVMVLGSINGVNGATSSVNVGIGTTSPQTALEIVDASVITSSTVEGNLNVVSNDPQAIDLGGSISLGGTNNDAGTIYRTFGTIEGRKANSTTANNLGYLVFKTNSGVLGERMRITSSGDVGIGTDTPGGQFELSLNEGRKPGTNTWTVTSDARLKTVNGDFTMGLAEIKQLRPIRYHYKNAGGRTFDPKVLETEFSGFLAQEVRQIFPNCVSTDADGYLSLDVHDILIASVNALKELDGKNAQLQSENEALKKKLEEHDRQIAAILAELEKRK